MSKNRKKSRGRILSSILIAAALAVLLFSAWHLFIIFREYHRADAEYDTLREYTSAAESDSAAKGNSALSPSSADAESVDIPVSVDFQELKSVNPEIIGWLYVGSVNISYPIVQGKDDDYYLHRTFSKEKNFAGSIFAEAKNSSGFQDPNTILYGHNMRNGSMFGSLDHLKTADDLKDDPYIWVLTPSASYRYTIFSIHKTKPGSEIYTLFSLPDQQFTDYVRTMSEESDITLQTPSADTRSRVITLSTCTGDSKNRFVVQGIRQQ